MAASRLIAYVALAALAGSDPTSLVRKLGAPKYADRQAASSEIERLGADALSALRSARTSEDAEVRSRATTLLARIENDLMVRPTMVSLDFRDVPLSRAIAVLAERGQAGLSLAPSSRAAGDRRITLVDSEPVPFWDALGRLSRAGGVELSGSPPMIGFGAGGARSIPLTLIGTPAGARPAPASISGPYRVTLLSLTHHKERIFAGGTANTGMIRVPADEIMRIQQAGLGLASGGGPDQFFASIQILAEPRMNVVMNGLPRVVEAVDDRGNSLIAAVPANNPFMHNSGYSQFSDPGGPLLQTNLPLHFPDRAGRTIKRLRGVVPLTVTARKDDPLTILLADAKGKTYHAADVRITVNDVRAEPDGIQSTLDLTIQPEGGDPVDPNAGGFGAVMPIVRGPGSPQNPMEIVDAQGRPSTQWHLQSHMQTPDGGSRITIRLMPSPGTGPATHLRFHELSRVNTEAEFEFVDIDMP